MNTHYKTPPLGHFPTLKDTLMPVIITYHVYLHIWSDGVLYWRRDVRAETGKRGVVVLQIT